MRTRGRNRRRICSCGPRPPRTPRTEPQYIELEFASGDPVVLDGQRLGPAEMLVALNALGARHGIGRVDMVENRYAGMKSRGIYETPGGTILHAARRAVEHLTLDREVMQLRDSLIPRYAQMIYNGYWFAPERQILQQALDASQARVTGTVRLKLYKGSASVAGRRSPVSLYDPVTATFERDDGYNQADAEGFIKLNALRLKMAGRVAGA